MPADSLDETRPEGPGGQDVSHVYAPVLEILKDLGEAGLATATERLHAVQRAAGATFAAIVDGRKQERIFPLDLVPRIIGGAAWDEVAAGLEQRSRALNAFLVDVYGPREGLRAGVAPASVVTASPGLRDTGGAGTSGAPATVAGMDLLRDGDGKWLVLEDNLRVPSGLGYAINARTFLADAVPGLAEAAGSAGVRPLTGVVAQLREALEAAAPPQTRAAPSIVVLSAGPSDSAWFEHQALAEGLGVALVTPEDLGVESRGSSRVVARLADGPLPIDVVYRRMDEDELAQAPSADGVSALELLASAVRAGVLGVANALGTGVADDKAVYAFVPRMIEFYLGETPLLDNVPTWHLAEEASRDEVLDRLAELVVKPVDGYGGRGVYFGDALSTDELSRLRRRIESAPERWVAQEPVVFSSHTCWTADSGFAPRHVDLRTFTFSGEQVVTVPAALTRVAPAGSRVVNSSRGGGAKDTWILPTPPRSRAG